MPPVVLETQHALTDFVGREIALTEWLTITQDRIDRFAEATQDRQWIHVDRERAQRESPYGTTIAHGFLTLSLLSFFMKQVIQFRGGVRMGINYGIDRVRFTAPVPVGSEVRLHARLLSGVPRGEGVLDKVGVQIQIKGAEKPALVGEVLYLVFA